MQSYDTIKTKSIEGILIGWLTKNSATILVIAAVASFAITALIEFFYYIDIFSLNLTYELATGLAIILAIFFQVLRCASLASTSRMFSLGAHGKGSLTLLVSLGITIFCAYEAGQIAAIWEATNQKIAGHIKLPILALVWSGWILELILIANVSTGGLNNYQKTTTGQAGGSSNGSRQSNPNGQAQGATY